MKKYKYHETKYEAMLEGASDGQEFYLASDVDTEIERLSIVEGEYATFRKCAAKDMERLNHQLAEQEEQMKSARITIDKLAAALDSELDSLKKDHLSLRSLCERPVAWLSRHDPDCVTTNLETALKMDHPCPLYMKIGAAAEPITDKNI